MTMIKDGDLPEYNFQVIREGEVGSAFWEYRLNTTPERTRVIKGEGISARIVDNHYLLSFNHRGETEGVEEINKADRADVRMRKVLYHKLKKLIKDNESHYKINITDNQGILGDLSKLLPQTVEEAVSGPLSIADDS